MVAPILGEPLPMASHFPACLRGTINSQLHQVIVNISYTSPHNAFGELLRTPGPASQNYTGCEEPSEWEGSQDHPYSRAICSWNYECDYDYYRVPQFIFHAKCSNDIIQFRKNSRLGLCQCKPVHRLIPVLRYVSCDSTTNQQEWKMENQYVAVGCICHSA